LPAHALHSLIVARKKSVGQRVTMENTFRDLAATFRIRLGTVARADFLADLKETEPAFAVESPNVRDGSTSSAAEAS
jgi:transposase